MVIIFKIKKTAVKICKGKVTPVFFKTAVVIKKHVAFHS